MPNASQVLFKIVLSKFFLGQNGESRRSTSTRTILSAVWSGKTGIGIASAHFVK